MSQYIANRRSRHVQIRTGGKPEFGNALGVRSVRFPLEDSLSSSLRSPLKSSLVPSLRDTRLERPFMRNTGLEKPFMRDIGLERPFIRNTGLERPFRIDSGLERPFVHGTVLDRPLLRYNGPARPLGSSNLYRSVAPGMPDDFPLLYGDKSSDMMIQMRRQMEQLFGRGGAGNGTEIDIYEPFPQLPFGPDFNLDKGNTTSVTKVIDGHKVVINETEYKDEGENGGAYFKVRIIDVKPDSSEFTTEKEAEDVNSNQDRESMENSKENEIPKTEIPLGSRFIETFDEVDAAPFRRPQYAEHFSNYLEDIEPVYQVDNNYLDFPQRPYDLSHDTDVNDILAASGASMDPDAEFVSFDVDSSKPFEKLESRR